MTNKQRIEEALAIIETDGDATYVPTNNRHVKLAVTEGLSSLPGIALGIAYVDAKDCRQLAKFFKALGDSIEARFA